MKLTYFGHACFLVELAGKRILFDPFISPNPKATHIDVLGIQADYILISHGHADHVADCVVIAQKTGATVVSNFEIVTWLSQQGIDKTHPMNHGGRWDFDFGRVQYVNAIHSSSLPDGSYGGNPGGFVISSREGSFYYSGDTALTYDMKLIAASQPVDFAVLCIGDNFTMGYEDACTAAEWVGAQKVVGVHYDTFPPIEIDHQAAQDFFTSKGRSLLLPDIGETIELK